MGILLIDFTSLAPTAISATISLELRPFSAAADLFTPSRLMSGLGPKWALVASIRMRPCQSMPLSLGHVHPMRGEDNDIAFSRLRLRTSRCAWTEFGDQSSPGLRSSRIGYDNLMTSVDQVTSECPGHISSTDEAYSHDGCPF
jgi:hypothetical protein